MSSAENIIVKEPGPFYDQPHWVEDFYTNLAATGGCHSARLAFGAIPDSMRQRHDFNPDAEGFVLKFSDPYEPDKGWITGAVLDKEQLARFLQFVSDGFRIQEKNNFVLLDDIVAAIVQNGLFTTDHTSLDIVYDIVREAVYRNRPHSGPDDVWTDTIVDALYNEGFVDPKHPWNTLREFFTRNFTDLVYGHHPKPEPSRTFVEDLAAELDKNGYANPDFDAPSLQKIVSEAAAKPHSPWPVEPPAPSRLRETHRAVKDLKKELLDLGYITEDAHNTTTLTKLLEKALSRG